MSSATATTSKPHQQNPPHQEINRTQELHEKNEAEQIHRILERRENLIWQANDWNETIPQTTLTLESRLHNLDAANLLTTSSTPIPSLERRPEFRNAPPGKPVPEHLMRRVMRNPKPKRKALDEAERRREERAERAAEEAELMDAGLLKDESDEEASDNDNGGVSIKREEDDEVMMRDTDGSKDKGKGRTKAEPPTIQRSHPSPSLPSSSKKGSSSGGRRSGGTKSHGSGSGAGASASGSKSGQKRRR